MPKAKYTYNEKRKEWYTLVYDGTLTPTGAKHRKRITSKKSSVRDRLLPRTAIDDIITVFPYLSTKSLRKGR